MTAVLSFSPTAHAQTSTPHSSNSSQLQVELTPEERAWLDQNLPVWVRIVDYPPYIIFNSNEAPQGIVIEYLKLIGERSGITFEFEVTDQPFAEFLEGTKRAQGPDMTPIIMPTPEREQFLSENPRARILALSIHSSRRYIEEMLKAGVAGYLLKESAPEELIPAIFALRDGKGYLSTEITDIGNEKLL